MTKDRKHLFRQELVGGDLCDDRQVRHRRVVRDGVDVLAGGVPDLSTLPGCQPLLHLRPHLLRSCLVRRHAGESTGVNFVHGGGVRGPYPCPVFFQVQAVFTDVSA